MTFLELVISELENAGYQDVSHLWSQAEIPGQYWAYYEHSLQGEWLTFQPAYKERVHVARFQIPNRYYYIVLQWPEYDLDPKIYFDLNDPNDDHIIQSLINLVYSYKQ